MTENKQAWRRLEFGEIIQAGDEIDRCSDPWRDPPKWEPVHPSDIGRPAPDTQYPLHRQYRRRCNFVSTIRRDSRTT